MQVASASQSALVTQWGLEEHCLLIEASLGDEDPAGKVVGRAEVVIEDVRTGRRRQSATQLSCSLRVEDDAQ